MFHKFDMGDKFQSLKTFVLGLALGAVVVALMLDNRGGAMIKAFQNPVAVNGMKVNLQVSQK